MQQLSMKRWNHVPFYTASLTKRKIQEERFSDMENEYVLHLLEVYRNKLLP